MKYLLSWLFACLFVVSCTCDGEILCDGEEEWYIQNTVYFSGFSQDERDNLQMVLHSKDNDEIIGSHLISSHIYKPFSPNKYTYNLRLPLLNYDMRTHYYVFQVNNFRDTINNFNYETRDSTFNCYEGCNGGTSTRTYTVYDNFYFIHQGDTIRKEESFTIRQ